MLENVTGMSRVLISVILIAAMPFAIMYGIASTCATMDIYVMPNQLLINTS